MHIGIRSGQGLEFGSGSGSKSGLEFVSALGLGGYCYGQVWGSFRARLMVMAGARLSLEAHGYAHLSPVLKCSHTRIAII